MKKAILLLNALAIGYLAHSQTIVADYTFSNGSANDVSGNGHHGTIIGGVTPSIGQSGTLGSAMKFDGSTGYIQVPSSASLDLTSWTLMANVKFDGFNSSDCQENRLIDRASTNDYSNDFYSLAVGDNLYDLSCTTYSPTKELLHGGVAGASMAVPPTTSYINVGEWYCLIATFSNDTLKTYINGVLNNVNRMVSHYAYPSNAPLNIGRHINPSFPYYFKGIMDRATIWNGALNLNQITGACSMEEPTGVPTFTNINPDVYPNPAFTELNIPVKASTEKVTVVITSSNGQEVQHLILDAKNNNIVKVSTANLQPGFYFIKIKDAYGNRVKSFVKM